MYVKCSPTLPLQAGERWIVRGPLGEPNEIWKVQRILVDKKSGQQFAFIAEIKHETKH